MKKLNKIPKLKSETEEKIFWLIKDSTDFLNWYKAKISRFPNLKTSKNKIVNKFSQK